MSCSCLKAQCVILDQTPGEAYYYIGCPKCSTDTIYGKICSNLHIVYMKSNDNWFAYYEDGRVREFGKFKKIGGASKLNLSRVKIGIWNYYSKEGTLIKVLDYGKGKLGSE